MSVEAGWYDDPDGSDNYRYWDGGAWTEHRHEHEPDVTPAEPAAADRPVEVGPGRPKPPSIVSSARTSHLSPPRNWCRACGAEGSPGSTSCDICGWELRSVQSEASVVGLVFEQKSRIGRTTRSICVAESKQMMSLHVSAKSTIEVESSSVSPTDIVDAELSIPGRMYRAFELLVAGEVKAKWDGVQVTDSAWELATADATSMRALFDDALNHEWAEIIERLPLSDQEKAWRRAHHAAMEGRVVDVAYHMQDLPDAGYPTRIDLLLPFLGVVLESDRSDWIALLSRWSGNITGRDLLMALLKDEALEISSCDAMLQELKPTLPEIVYDQWASALRLISIESTPKPVAATTPMWSAYRWLITEEEAQPSPESLGTLSLAMLDDAVDDGRLQSHRSVTGRPTDELLYLQGRTEPDSLSLEELRNLTHHAELARRLFLNRGVTGMASLPQEDANVRHYGALLRLVADGQLDEEALLGTGHETLVDAARQRDLVKKGELTSISDSIASDPSLWTMFSELALKGNLESPPGQRLAYPEYGEWLDLHRVLRMVWSGENREAAELAGRMALQLKDETLRDEALNLQAFSLATVGDINSALRCLEDAMEGEYTQALLINTGLVAIEAEPVIATKYLNRLILEAPTLELQVGAMDRAVQLWMGTPDLHLHPDTAHCLYHLLLEPSLGANHYISFLRLAASVDSARIANDPLPRPADSEKLSAWEIFSAMAQTRNGDMDPADYAAQIIATSKTNPDERWIEVHRNNEIDLIREALFEPLGESLGAAMAADKFLLEGHEFLARHTYFFFSIRTAMHLAFFFQAQDGALSDEAMRRLLLVPAEEFDVERTDMPGELGKVLDDQFYIAFSVMASIKFDETRPESNALFRQHNVLIDRLRWDSENRRAIREDLRRILARQQEMIDEVKRVADRVPRFAPMNPPEGERPLIDIVKQELREWQAEVIRLRSNL